MHQHDHGHHSYNKAFAIGVFLNTAFIVVEVVFGLIAGSMALIADAGHNLSDVVGLIVAWAAAYLTGLEPTPKRTYGWRKASILAALSNSVILLVALGAITSEAVRRVLNPEPVGETTIMIVAGVGVVINTLTALLFMKGHKHDLNIRGAFLHMAADAGVSLGVVIAGGLIALTGRLWLDPAVSLLIVVVILIGTWHLLRDSFNLAMDAVPGGLKTEVIKNHLLELPGIDEVHDLHVWAMSTTETALTAHLIKPDPQDDDEMMSRIVQELHDQYGIEHVTIQWERETCARFSENGTCG